MVRSRRNNLFILAILILGIRINSNAQCGFIQSDKFDNIWVVNHSEIICYNNQLQKIGSYSSLMHGNPSYIDALDPFRVLVFFKNTQVITFLNNKVSEISNPVNLKEKGISDASLACRSSKGGIWVFDRIKWEIGHFDSGFNSTGEKIIPEAISSNEIPVFMQEYKGLLLISFKNKGISKYDSFGSYLGELPVNVEDYFSIVDSSIIYQSAGKYYQFNIETNENTLIQPQPKCMFVKIQGKYLYFDGNRLAVHKIR